MRSIVFIAAAAFALPSAARGEPEEDRAFLAGEAPGSLAQPERLAGAEAARALCAAVAVGALDGPPDPARRRAARKVYAVRVDPAGFTLERRARGLALDLRRPLSALRGDVTLSVLDRKSGTFAVAEAASAGLERAAAGGRVALDVVFRLEGRDADLPPCFTAPQSGIYALRVEPLSYALVDAGTGAELARTRTPRWTKLESWLRPGEARVGIEVDVRRGSLEPSAVRAALDAEAVERCVAPVADSAAGAGLLSLRATVGRGGRLEDVQVEIDALPDPAAAECVAAALRGAALRTAKIGAEIAVRVEVARGD